MKKSKADIEADLIAEKLSLSNDTQEMHSPTELGGAFQELNRDEYDKKTGQSSIDLRSYLLPHEVTGVIVNDASCSMGVNPPECLSLSRQKKRLAPSTNGIRAEQMVRMTQNIRDDAGAAQSQSFMSRLFGGKKSE